MTVPAPGSAPSRAVVAALLLVTALLAVDITDQRVSLVGALVIGPFLAGAFAGPRAAAGVGAFAIAGSLVGLLWAGGLDYGEAVRFVALVGGSALSVVVAAERYDRERALRDLREFAEAAQLSILRPLPERVGHVAAGARYVAAVSEATMGGDFFELMETPFGVRGVVGDVRGKGRFAMRLAATVLNRFRQAAAEEPDLSAVVRAMEAAVRSHGADEDFATALVVEFTPGKVQVLSCGHHPPLLLQPDGARFLDVEPDLPLGLGTSPSPTVAPFEQGRLLCYTDGIVEARDTAGRFFPLLRHAGRLTHRPIHGSLDELLAALHRHTGARLHDDVAVLLVAAELPAAPRPGLRTRLRRVLPDGRSGRAALSAPPDARRSSPR